MSALRLRLGLPARGSYLSSMEVARPVLTGQVCPLAGSMQVEDRWGKVAPTVTRRAAPEPRQVASSTHLSYMYRREYMLTASQSEALRFRKRKKG